MDIKALIDKLIDGERELTDEEAKLILSIIKESIIEKGGFEKRGYKESISLSSDSCVTCGRSY